MRKILVELKKRLTESIVEEIGNEKKIGVLFSAGIDSAIISFLASKVCKVINYTAGTKDSEDIAFAMNLRKNWKGKIKIIILNERKLEKEKERLIKILEENGIEKTKLNIALTIPVYFASREAKKDGIKVMLSGQGADVIFGGYARYLRMKEEERIKAMERDIEEVYRDLKRDLAVCKYNKIYLKFPYINKKVFYYAKKIPIEFKIYEIKNSQNKEEYDSVDGKKFIRKFVLRKLAQEIGIPIAIVKRKKKAMQYGSGSEKLLNRIEKF